MTTRSALNLFVVFVLGFLSGAALMVWLAPGPDPAHERLTAAHVRLTAAHVRRCTALRELATILVVARNNGVPLSTFVEIFAEMDKKAGYPESDMSKSLAQKLDATPEWNHINAARAVEARCLEKSP